MPSSTKHAELVSTLEKMLNFRENGTDAYKIYNDDSNLDFIEAALQNGVSADLVLHHAILFKKLPLIKTAFRYNPTKNFIIDSLKIENREIPLCVIAETIKQNNREILTQIDGKVIAHCLEHNFDLLEMFGELIRVIEKKQRALLITACLLQNVTHERIYPFVYACIKEGISHRKPHLFPHPLISAMKNKHPDIVKAVLTAGTLRHLKQVSVIESIIDMNDSVVIQAFVSEFDAYLRSPGMISQEALKKLQLCFNHALALALELATESTNNTEQINYYLSLGARPTNSTLYNLSSIYPWELFLRVFTLVDKPSLTPGIVACAYRSQTINIYTELSKYILNTDKQTLTNIVSNLLNIFIPYVPNVELKNRVASSDVLRFMKACIYHGADINHLNDILPPYQADHRWKERSAKYKCTDAKIYSTHSPSKVTFLHAAMIANCTPLIPFLLEAGANTEIRLKCIVTNTTETDHGPSTADLGNAKSRLLFYKTITTKVIPQQEMHLIVFLLLQSMSQVDSSKTPPPLFSTFSPNVMLNLISYLIPDNDECNYVLSSYKNIFHNNEHFFFKNETKHAEIPQQLLLETIKSPITRS